MNMDYETACPLPQAHCPADQGSMPPCAGLSVSYVPFQKNHPKTYAQNEALSNGTLFPSLNLPFYLKVDGGKLPDTPLAELQALQFVVLDLGTYLDTHQEDQEAFALFKQYVAMERSARALYEEKFGPISRSDTVSDHHYTWLRDPWPWNYPENDENEVK